MVDSGIMLSLYCFYKTAFIHVNGGVEACHNSLLVFTFSYISALEFKVILDFIGAVIVRHFPLFHVCRQIGRQPLPLVRQQTDTMNKGQSPFCLNVVLHPQQI